MLGDCDIISVAGAVKNIIGPEDLQSNHSILSQVKTSFELHKIYKVILSNHVDCGAYGGSDNFSSLEEEKSFHLTELRRAKTVMRSLFPQLEVETAIAIIRNDVFEVEEVG